MVVRFARNAWQALETPPAVGQTPGPDAPEALPDAARRFLERSVPVPGSAPGAVVLEMVGEIRIGKWRPFRAEQILRPGVGLVWAPTVGSMPTGFVGADILTPDLARMEFRLGGLVPVARAQGEDVRRSALGRLAAETVSWAPWALWPTTGPPGAPEWSVAIDPSSAAADEVDVLVPTPGEPVSVTLQVDGEGRPGEVRLRRWRDSVDPPAYASFGATCESDLVLDDGTRIVGSGTVGWDWGTPEQPEGEFFRYRLTSARRLP